MGCTVTHTANVSQYICRTLYISNFISSYVSSFISSCCCCCLWFQVREHFYLLSRNRTVFNINVIFLSCHYQYLIKLLIKLGFDMTLIFLWLPPGLNPCPLAYEASSISTRLCKGNNLSKN